jgi:hypothetical protein
MFPVTRTPPLDTTSISHERWLTIRQGFAHD